MRSLAQFVGIVVMVIGGAILVAPDRFIALGDEILTQRGLYAIAAIRVVVGLILFAAASASRAPKVLRVVGLIVVVAGVGTPLFGAERSRQIFHWWASQGPAVLHAPGVLLIALGAGLTYLTGAGRRA